MTPTTGEPAVTETGGDAGTAPKVDADGKPIVEAGAAVVPAVTNADGTTTPVPGKADKKDPNAKTTNRHHCGKTGASNLAVAATSVAVTMYALF